MLVIDMRALHDVLRITLGLLLVASILMACGNKNMTTDQPNTDSQPQFSKAQSNEWFGTARWQNRMLVFCGPAATTERQLAVMQAAQAEVLDRDMLIIDINGPMAAMHLGEAEPAPDSLYFTDRFELPTDGSFQVVLIGKDGLVKERRGDVFEVAEMVSIIDAMPMRRDEMRDDA